LYGFHFHSPSQLSADFVIQCRITNKRLSVVRAAPNSGGDSGFGAHDG
jgi:hypothetical protein